jgi:hypothetical protein
MIENHDPDLIPSQYFFEQLLFFGLFHFEQRSMLRKGCLLGFVLFQAINENICASCCVLVKVEIINPNETAVMINNNASPISKNKLPLMGTSSRVTLTSRIVATFTSDKKM